MGDKPKWTPGPWLAAEGPGGNVRIASETKDDIAYVVIDDTDEDALAETVANVSLALAAPAMAEALRMILDDLDGDSILIVSIRSIEAARAVLALAEGGK